MNEAYIIKLISLINQGVITVDDIKNETYKAEVIRRMSL